MLNNSLSFKLFFPEVHKDNLLLIQCSYKKKPKLNYIYTG